MKLLFLGDSITEGVGASAKDKNYVNLVKSELGCEAVNYGVSGTRIGRQTRVYGGITVWNYDFRLRAQIMERVGLTPQHIARDVVAQVLGSKIPIARPLEGESENERHITR
jgi:hypothetical protein